MCITAALASFLAGFAMGKCENQDNVISSRGKEAQGRRLECALRSFEKNTTKLDTEWNTFGSEFNFIKYLLRAGLLGR